MSERLSGKVAVVTGGGNGIGRACCERFAEEGADVVVADLLVDNAEEVAAVVEKLGRRALAVQLDAVSPSDNEAVMASAVDALGGIDIVLTAAGILHAGYKSGDREAEQPIVTELMTGIAKPAKPFLDLGLDEWQKVLDVNLTGTFLAVQAAARHMVPSGRGGSIITIASIAAKMPDAGPMSYAVSKAGVWMLTKHTARSLAGSRIRVNAIGPGFIATNMTRFLEDFPQELVDTYLLAGVPLGRVGTPVEVANVALFLASDESSYMTGEILHPDGGFFTD